MEKSKVLKFVLMLVAFYVAWHVVYEYWIAPNGKIDAVLTSMVSHASLWLLKTLNYDIYLTPNNTLCSPERPLVYVGNPCNGFALYMLHTFFMVAAAGQWAKKLLFIALGLVMIYVLNVIRVAALTVNMLISRETFHFNHHYLFTFIVYGAVFGLWVYWFNKHSLQKQV